MQIEKRLTPGDIIYRIGEFVKGAQKDQIDHLLIDRNGVVFYYNSWGGYICNSLELNKIIYPMPRENYRFGWVGFFFSEEEAMSALNKKKEN